VIAVDVENEAMVGLVDAAIWTRGEEAADEQRRRPSEEKESARWLAGCRSAAETLVAAARLTMVADRESDIYALFARRPAGLDLIVRAAQNRNLADGTKLFAALDDAPRLSLSQVRVAPRGPGDKGRIATVEVRARRLQIARPDNGLVEDFPAAIEMSLVEARETDPPQGKTALHWRLLTTMPVASAARAEEVVQLYRLRWRIEQTFRALKSDGLALEDSQIIEPERMFNLAALALISAIRIISTRRCQRRRATPRCRRHRRQLRSTPQAPLPQARRKDPAPEESPSPAVARLRRLDRRQARRMELLLQTPRTQDHGPRLEEPRRKARGLFPRHPSPTSVNPVAL